MEIGESEATTRQTVRVVHVSGVEMEDYVGVSTCPEILSRSMAIDVFVSPRGVHEVGAAPYESSETVPEEIRARKCPPRGTDLHAIKRHIHT